MLAYYAGILNNKYVPTKLAYSVTEAAELLSISTTEIRRLEQDGLLRRVPHVGKRVLFSHAELVRFANNGVAA